MPRSDLILGIESSCDDTAAAVVRSDRTILSSVVVDQSALHRHFGGIVPEIAARAHAEKLDAAVEIALREADISLAALDAIAVTAGPGLIGGVLSGVMLARGLATGADKPLLGINHLAGHSLTPRLTDDVAFPYLVLLVSGGHCQFIIAHNATTYERLGGTIDDAPGEAFDKVARLLGLPQPGGPSVETEAKAGDPKRHDLPRPLLGRPGCDMSFSGLKTAVLRARDLLVDEYGGLRSQDRSDICASFQEAVADVLAAKAARALAEFLSRTEAPTTLALAGGVSANNTIRRRIERVAAEHDAAFIAPPLRLCTDNAAMIAWAGAELRQVGDPGMIPLVPRPRWPLDSRAPALLGSGKKGAKA